jgi:alpha-glucosidase
LSYLAGLGVDAIWMSPWYPSPMADAGYDVADFRDIDPVFGTLAEAEKFIEEAHGLNLRVIIDIVPNHCSTAHKWFVEALSAGPGSPARDLFWFRPGRGPNGGEPPTDLQSIFGGPAWTRVTEPDGRPGEWYLHLFAPEQPDFNWDNPVVRDEFDDILRFWFDRGVDGIRIDSAAVVVKDFDDPVDPYTDRDGVHDVYRQWRRVAQEYDARVLIGEIWLPDVERFTAYLRPDELHTAFNFDFLCCPWDAPKLRKVIDETLAMHEPVGAPSTWVLSNHDVTRHVTRYGRTDSAFSFPTRGELRRLPLDLALGTRRARAAALLSLALPGSAYVYQGEELGLWEVEDVPEAMIQDPMYYRSGGSDPGRDGCRVPLPWSGDAPPFGNGTPGTTPWLPQPEAWRQLTVEAQAGDPDSMLELYRTALAIRRGEASTADGAMRWLPAPDGVLAFCREPAVGGRDHQPGLACVVNLSADPVELPPHRSVLLSSGPLDGARLPSDTAVWLRV